MSPTYQGLQSFGIAGRILSTGIGIRISSPWDSAPPSRTGRSVWLAPWRYTTSSIII